MSLPTPGCCPCRASRGSPLARSRPIHSSRSRQRWTPGAIYCGDNLEQLAKLPDACVDLIYIDPPFNSNRNYEVFWGETKEKRAFEDRHESTQAYIDYMRPRCVELARVLKKTGSFYYHCDWHASALRQGDARPDLRREPVSERDRSGSGSPRRTTRSGTGGATTPSSSTRHRSSISGTLSMDPSSRTTSRRTTGTPSRERGAGSGSAI